MMSQLRSDIMASAVACLPPNVVISSSVLTRLNEFSTAVNTTTRAQIGTLVLAFLNELGPLFNYTVTEEAQHVIRAAVLFALCGGDLNNQRTQTSHVCGHVFKKGEVIYRCRTCGIDDTCVLCSRCYAATNHEGHYVFYSVSAGNGCCDCGDPEAWKAPIGCKYHLASNADSVMSATTNLPADVVVSVDSVIDAVISFIVSSLQKHQRPTTTPTHVAENSEKVLDFGPKAIVLYNDELHSFEQVINQLTSPPIGCSRQEAHARAQTVDSVGRDIVMVTNDPVRCRNACEQLWAIGLKTSSVPAVAAFNESMSVVLLDHLRALCIENTGYRRIVCEKLCTITNANGAQLPERLDFLLTVNHKLWKAARQAMRDLFFYSLLLDDLVFKRILGARFVVKYPELVEDFLKNDDEPDFSIIFISLQLFTTPTIATFLVKEHHLLSTIIQSLLTFFSTAAIPAEQREYRACVDVRKEPFSNEHYEIIFHDLRYVLSKKAVQRYAVLHIEHLQNYLELLNLFQGMDLQKRERAHHVEYETNIWLRVFRLAIQLTKTTPMMAACFSVASNASPAEVTETIRAMDRALNLTIKAILRHDATLPVHTASLYYIPKDAPITLQMPVTFSHDDQTPPYFLTRVSRSPVTLHNPLHWMLGSLLLNALIDRPDTLNISDYLPCQNLVNLVDLMRLLNPPLSSCVLLAQVGAGLWRRNGYTIREQCHNYMSVLFRHRAHSMDLLVMQAIACAMNPDHFLHMIVDHMELHQWFSSLPTTQFDMSQSVFLAEECLSLVIALVNERWQVTLADPSARIRRCLIQALVGGNLTHSELSKLVDNELVETPALDEVLNEIAEFKFPEGSDHGYYQLRDQFYDEYEPFLFHSRRADREKAEEGYRNYRKSHSQPNVFKPSKLLPLTGSMARLRLLFHTPAYIGLIAYTLMSYQRSLSVRSGSSIAAGTESTPLPTSQTLVDMALHLTILAILDVEQHLDEQNPACPTPAITFIQLLTHSRIRVDDNALVTREPETQDDMSTAHRPSYVTLLTILLQLWKHRKAHMIYPALDWIIKKLAALGDHEARQQIDQVGGLVDESQSQGEDQKQAELQRKLESRKRQEEIMREFAARQKSFAESFPEDLEDEEIIEVSSSSSTFLPAPEDVEGLISLETEPCIFCQGATDVQSSRPFGLLGMIQASSILRRASAPDWVSNKLPSQTDYSGLDVEWPIPTMENEDIVPDHNAIGCSGAHVSTCGHFMHQDCFNQFTAQTDRGLEQMPNTMLRWIHLCPLCKTSCNILLPLISHELAVRERCVQMPFDEWLTSAQELAHMSPPTFDDDDNHDDDGGDDDANNSDMEYVHASNSEVPQIVTSSSPPTLSSLGVRNTSAPIPIQQSPSSRPLIRRAMSSDSPWLSPRSASSNSPGSEERRELGVFSLSGTRRLLSNRSPSASPSASSEGLLRRTMSESETLRPTPVDGNTPAVTIPRVPVSPARSVSLSARGATAPSPSPLGALLAQGASPSWIDEDMSESDEDEEGEMVGINNTPDAFSLLATSSSSSPPQTHDAAATGLSPQTVTMLGNMITRLRQAIGPSPQNELVPLHPAFAEHSSLHHLLAAYIYTLQSTEAASRGQKPLPQQNILFCEDMSHQLLLLIKTMSEAVLGYITSLDQIPNQTKPLPIFAYNLLQKIFLSQHEPKLRGDVILLDDPFAILVQAIYAVPPDRFDLAHFIRLMYYVEITRILLVASTKAEARDHDGDGDDEAFESTSEDREQVSLHHFAKFVAEKAFGKRLSFKNIDIVSLVRFQLLPFLRCTAVLCFAHFDVPIRKRLRGMTDVHSELDKLLVYLQLPSLAEVFLAPSSPMTSLVANWCERWRLYTQQNSSLDHAQLVPQLTYAYPYFLMPLTKRFDVLLRQGNRAACSRCGSTRGEPVLCLICGVYVCFNPYCLRDDRTGCFSHAQSHHAGLGLYLIDRQCALFITHDIQNCFHNAPYLDAHGESDFGLRRGRPLELNLRRFNDLRNLWLNHRLASLVARTAAERRYVNQWNMV